MKRELDYNYLSLLKRRLEDKTGIRVFEFNDCNRLSNALAQEKINISAHTLARFYDILKREHKPYRSTLNLMANFVGFRSFEDFCQNENEATKNRLNRKFSFSTGDFSFSALEIAIAQSDWKHVCQVLDTYEIDKRKQALTDFLGNEVRHHKDRFNFLKALMKIENGRHLFYESFVDEDDPGGYYSMALENLYKKAKKDTGSRFFVESYLTSKKIYNSTQVSSERKIMLSEIQLNPEDFHFHQLSRWFELRILIAHQDGKNFGVISKIVEEMLSINANYHFYDRRWILARSLKALAHCGLWRQALEIHNLKNEILLCYKNMEGVLSSIADLIVQLYAHLVLKDEIHLLPIMSLEDKHLNETNTRIAVESATALIYAQEPVKSILINNIVPFANNTGNSWVLNLIK